MQRLIFSVVLKSLKSNHRKAHKGKRMFRKKKKEPATEDLKKIQEQLLTNTLKGITQLTCEYLKGIRTRHPELDADIPNERIAGTELIVMRQLLSPQQPLLVSKAVCDGFEAAGYVASHDRDGHVTKYTYAPQTVRLVK